MHPNRNEILPEPVMEVAQDSPDYLDNPVRSNQDERMWAVNGDDYYPCNKATKKLEPGQYVFGYEERGIFLHKKTINIDELIALPDNNSERVLDSIDHFWNNEQVFRDYGFLWKRGILLVGPPGGGKTSTVQQLSKQIIDRGGISIFGTQPGLDAKGLSLLRRIEPNRPIVVILEDIDAMIRRDEAEMLALLDGEHQIDNVVYVATTNYPELLDRRFTNRPSRFDEIVVIDMPSPESRRVFLKAKNPKLSTDSEMLERWISLTDRFSIAHLKELIISVECFNKDVDEAAERLSQMIEKEIKSDDFGQRPSIGFGGLSSTDCAKVSNPNILAGGRRSGKENG